MLDKDILPKIKLSLRISGDDFDDEISDLISECKIDLETSGVSKSLFTDEPNLIYKAVRTYCKANFGYDNPDKEYLSDSYEKIKIKLSLINGQ